MKVNRVLQLNGTMLTKEQLKKHLENIASEQNIIPKSKKDTYPVPRVLENFNTIKQVYQLLSEHVKKEISIHPAGEWILDNFYAIEQTVKTIEKELTLKKYINFPGIANGNYCGFARIYLLASYIVAYTDNIIDKDGLEQYISSYQNKKTLIMDEVWNIGIFLEIAIIENIAQICKQIYNSQIQKERAEIIVEKTIENNNEKFNINLGKKIKIKKTILNDTKYSFIEYLAYTLKKYGKKGGIYLQALEEIVEMSGNSVYDIIRKEHYNIAIKKILIGNGITSLKEIQRLNFIEIFEKINGVEELLKKDPSQVYDKMDYKTKEYYRMKIKEISQKTKISEIYITKKMLELANKEEKGTKRSHIGFYLIKEGINELYNCLGHTKKVNIKNKAEKYIIVLLLMSCLLSILFSIFLYPYHKNILLFIISEFIFFIPISEFVTQLIQWILGKVIKPKIIPKMNFEKGIPKDCCTMVVIPTILDSCEKTKELIKKLEVFYLANKTENIFLTLLGDCTTEKVKKVNLDSQIIQIGNEEINKLNKKYLNTDFPIFNFLYRKRQWSKTENCYLGWERKRGLLNQLNKFLLKGQNSDFINNSIIENKIPKIKYIITLDADTDLILNSGLELVGAMAHILNKPVLDEKQKIVIDGYGLIQPRIGVNLSISNKNLFTKIFAGAGGIDLYTNAISDIYQDNFEEGIFTGKGIYDLEIFEETMNNEIPENTVLSHDLLEGSYVRTGLATDIMLMDGYPEKYTSYISRLSRWIRGDWQITKWLKKESPLNLLSKYKIFDNLRRSLFEITFVLSYILLVCIELFNNSKTTIFELIMSLIVFSPLILEIVNNINFFNKPDERHKTFTSQINGVKGAIIRSFLTFSVLPYKAFISAESIIKTIYRMKFSKLHLLEWTTSEEAEKNAKTNLKHYIKTMAINEILGLVILVIGIGLFSWISIIIGICWIIGPILMWKISRNNNIDNEPKKLNKEEKEYILKVGKKTWQYFEEFLTKDTNYLIPDNYQEDRNPKVILRTSSTNIGLSLLAVISAYDLKYISLDKCTNLIKKILETIYELEKWNGHLYNWYEIKNKSVLYPRYISTVDSGNFVGYLYVVKKFIENIIRNTEEDDRKSLNNEEAKIQIQNISKLIEETNFNVLYDSEHQLFSIGFNVEENKLTDSYYDLLASEARQTSLIAIAKRDVPVKHWNSLNRTLTDLGKYKGLISWSGTSFEYLMPNVNIKNYAGSLIDESCKFMIMSQLEYTKKLGIPWGISESAFNMKDLHDNYQYKAFGIPWLGLKRGLADEMVVSSYGSILAINNEPKLVISNMKELEKQGMYEKYGFYEAIDYTPDRVKKGKKSSIVKTYMAHHQALILLSINNLIENNILQKRFMENPEIQAVSILLQERMPERTIITKEEKEKIEKPKYIYYENYNKREYRQINTNITKGNVISNENYMIAMDQKGNGVSKYKDIYVNRFKSISLYNQGIFFYLKNIKTKNIWNLNYTEKENEQYKISFMPDKDEIEKIVGNIKSKMEVIIVPNEEEEIRKLTIENLGNEEEIIEVTSYFEPVLSNKFQDYAHPAYNNLFLKFNYDKQNEILQIQRNDREDCNKKIILQTSLYTECDTIGELEYEINKEKFLGRGNYEIPQMVKKSIPLSQKNELTVDPIVALKRTIKIKPNDKVVINLLISVGEDINKVNKNILKSQSQESINKMFELSKAKIEEENRYLRVKSEEIECYQEIMANMIFNNKFRKIYVQQNLIEKYYQKELWKYGISGDFPIVLVKIRNVSDDYVVKEMLKLYEYLRVKNINIELVFIDEEKHSYEKYVKEVIESEIRKL